MWKHCIPILLVFLGGLGFSTAVAQTLENPPEKASARWPLRVHPDNSLWLDDNTGKGILLTGSHTWDNFVDMGKDDPPVPFDFEQYLDFLDENGHNFIRLWRWEFPKYKYGDHRTYKHSAPHPWARVGPDRANDGRPKFDLFTFNEAYFDRLQQRVMEADKRGIYVGIMLFEGHALTQANDAWKFHPFHKDNNTSGINGDTNGVGIGIEIQSLDDRAMVAVQEAYVRKVIDTVNDFDNVLYEIGNECHQESDLWQRYMISVIQNYQQAKPKQHLVIYSAPVYTHGDFMWASHAEIIAPGKKRIGDAIPLQSNPPANDGRKIVMLDTDHLWGIGGDPQWVFKTFLRGMHPIYMDPYDHRSNKAIQRRMGVARRLADRVNLQRLKPADHLASTGYCLADGTVPRIVYLPDTESVTLDLSAITDTVQLEWIDPDSGVAQLDSTHGGSNITVKSPIGSESILLIRQ